MSNNEISILEPNLFQNNPELVVIWLNNNKIQYIDPNALTALKKVTFFNFYNNSCYSFISRSYEELAIDQYVSICLNMLPKIHAEILELKSILLRLSSENEFNYYKKHSVNDDEALTPHLQKMKVLMDK